MVGLEWLERGEQLLLKVPSVIVPIESHWIINPRHPQAKPIKILETTPFSIDQRLLT